MSETSISKMKGRLPAIIAVVVVAVLLLCICRVTYIPDNADLGGAALSQAGGGGAFTAEQYCAENWDSLMVPSIRELARDISELLPLIRADLASAGEQYAKRENETSAYNFCMSGVARVLEIESPERASRTRLVIDIQPYDGQADAKVQVSSVIRTNALRDAVGFLALDDFANQVEFAGLTTAFNARVQETVIANLDIPALDGQEIEFLGCVAISEYAGPDDCLIVPVELARAGE